MSNILDSLIVELSESHYRPSDPDEAPSAPIKVRRPRTEDTLVVPTSDDISPPDQKINSDNMQGELDRARQLIKSLQDQVDNLTSDRDSWQQQAEEIQQILVRDRKAITAPPRPSWWRRVTRWGL